MDNLRWLVRAAKWARHPPSAKMVALVFAIILAGLAILAAEKMDMWPDWAKVERGRGNHLSR